MQGAGAEAWDVVVRDEVRGLHDQNRRSQEVESRAGKTDMRAWVWDGCYLVNE